jgi:hypothetical protein
MLGKNPLEDVTNMRAIEEFVSEENGSKSCGVKPSASVR